MILIVTERDDYHALAVRAVLEREHQKEVCMLHTSEFPINASGVFETSETALGTRELVTKDGVIDLKEVASVWWRRPEKVQVPNELSVDKVEFLRAEASAFIEGLLWSTTAKWINRPDKQLTASRKIVQLTHAQNVGLRIPTTLITNNPSQARGFAKQFDAVIFKRVGASRHPSKTSLLTDSDLTNLDAIVSSPTVFQRYVEPGYDVRTIWLEGKMWSFGIDSSASDTPEDSRLDHTVDYWVETLPTEIEQKVTTLMNVLGLAYGAIDFRVDKHGSIYFLEVNAGGQFAYLQLKTGTPLIHEMASALASG